MASISSTPLLTFLVRSEDILHVARAPCELTGPALVSASVLFRLDAEAEQRHDPLDQIHGNLHVSVLCQFSRKPLSGRENSKRFRNFCQ